MKYFIDDNHRDIELCRELKKLLPRFSKVTSDFLKRHLFHDGKVVSLTVLNPESGMTLVPITT